jgi:CIC family chloride channel protein
MQAEEPGQSKELRRHLEPQPVAWWVMVLCSLAVGVIAGLGAVVFRAMIGGFHNLLFLGQWSFDYDANVHTPPSPWGAWIILVPVLGAIGVAFLVKTFAPEAKGHGVPEVMDAIYHQDGRIRPIVALIKSLASALSIGSGGSVGREGPIIQVGAAFGSTLGQVITMPVRQRAVLIAAGAGGGIAATFNTPIGGIVFAVELMLPFATPPEPPRRRTLLRDGDLYRPRILRRPAVVQRPVPLAHRPVPPAHRRL